MSDPVDPSDQVYIAQAHANKASLEAPLPEKETAIISTAPSVHDDGHEYPTDEELRTLRRVAGKVRWTAYTIAFVELCERFSYYGTTAVCMQCFASILIDPVVNRSSCQFYSATSPGGPSYRRWVLRPIWSSGHGTESFYRTDHL